MALVMEIWSLTAVDDNAVVNLEKLVAQLSVEEQLYLMERMAQRLRQRAHTAIAKIERPAPAKYYKGRPVYTEEQLLQMDNPLPNESEWVAEIRKHAAQKQQ